jgi:hypothetical protein
MRVAIQPESGALVPPDAAQSKALQGVVPEDPNAVVVDKANDGRITVHFNGQYQSYEVVRRAPDGSLQQECFTDPKAAQSYLQQPGTPTLDGLEVK